MGEQRISDDKVAYWLDWLAAFRGKLKRLSKDALLDLRDDRAEIERLRRLASLLICEAMDECWYESQMFPHQIVEAADRTDEDNFVAAEKAFEKLGLLKPTPPRDIRPSSAPSGGSR